MDSLCLRISDSQPCLGTLCCSPRRKVTPLIGYSAIRLGDTAWNSANPRGSFSCVLQSGSWIRARVRETQMPRREAGVGGGEKPVKSYEICPLYNQRPNQFVQRPRGAGALQRNVWSGRSPSVHPSPYLRQTYNSQSAREERWLGGMGQKHVLFSFVSFFHSKL